MNRSCFIFCLLALALPHFSSEAAVIERQVTIQPIIVCDDAGQNCPLFVPGFFETAGDRIWAEAGIDLAFLEPRTFNSSNHQTIQDAAEANELFETPGHSQHELETVLNLWVVIDVVGAFGRGRTGFNGMVIDQAVFQQGRIDTIAHEIGHNLGLDHSIWGAGGPENLMTAEGRRIPGQLCDIFSKGSISQLTVSQVVVSRSSQFAQPIAPFDRAPASPKLIIADRNLLIAESEAGFCYWLEATNSLTSDWTPVSPGVEGTGDALSWNFQPLDGNRFFRVIAK